MKEVHVLIDLENNQPTLDEVKRLVPDMTDAWLFHSEQQVKRLESYEAMGNKRTRVPIARPGPNSLDFHLSFYLGYIASKRPTARLVVVAIDGDYDPMIVHARELGFDVGKVPFKKPKVAAKTAKAAKTPPPAKQKVATAKKAPAAKKAAPAKQVAAAKASVPQPDQLYVKLVRKLEQLGPSRATRLAKLKAQVPSVLGLKAGTTKLVDDLVSRLLKNRIVSESATGRLQFKFD